jgi:uncharacterized RDD family membrane protein YckC
VSTPEDSRGQMPPGGWDRPVASAPPMAPFAGWWSRVGAALVDAILINIPAALVSIAVFGGVAGMGDDEAGFIAAIVGILLYLFLLALVAILYAPLLMRRPGARNGQTWGKQLYGIRVVRENGVPMDFTWSAVREPLVKGLGLGFASTIIPLIPYVIDALWPLWDDEKRAVHDMVVGTRVVKA